MARCSWVTVLLLAAAQVTAAQRVHAQDATAAKLGTVHFATSCNPRVAPTFDRAVALLHSFEFGASIQGFNDVLKADSTCAMAQWGIALSRWSNPMSAGNRAVPLLQTGRQAYESAKRLSVGATERERGYINAVGRLYEDFERTDQRTRMLAYERAMQELSARESSDTEAMIFYAIALIATASPTDKTFANQIKAGGILEAMWAQQPDHPGLAHYVIHAYDYPALADKARAAAKRYASIAPSAAHAQHMPSHTFTRVGMWQASIAANTESMKIALGSGSIAEALHAADYAMYANLQLGNEAAAKAILTQLPALAAKFDPNAVTGAAPGSAGVFALAAIPARWVLERRSWTEAAALEPKASAFPYTEAMTYLARALGASHTGDIKKAKASSDSLASIETRLRASGEAYWAEQVAIQHLTAQAWLELAQHHNAEALSTMREAASREDATEKNAVTPGPLAPARELLGDMLTQLKQPAEARKEYERTLQKEPNRRHTLRSLGRSTAQ